MSNDNDTYPFDPDMAVEETPGFLGYIFDGMLHFEPELGALSGFDWEQYGQMAEEIGQPDRRLVLEAGAEKIVIEANVWQINEFLGQLPSVEALFDDPPDQGPAGGCGYRFVVAGNGQAHGTIQSHALALKRSLEKDYEVVRKEFVADLEIQESYKERGLALPEPL